jgi:hypothetical protein
MSQISTRELDLIIKELERLADCYEKLNERVDTRVNHLDTKVEKKVDKSTERWKYLMIFGAYGFTLFVLGLLLKVHFGV